MPMTHQFVQHTYKFLRHSQAFNAMVHIVIQLLITELGRIRGHGKRNHLSLTYLERSLCLVELLLPQRLISKAPETSCEILDLELELQLGRPFQRD